MADLNRSNYQELLPEIKNKIKMATFICFDAEFSGLGQPDEMDNTSLFDTGAERYVKMRNIVLHNTSPQVGFGIFRKDEDESKNIFHVDAYEAYITEPVFADFNMKRKTLSLEYKCSKFLRKCKFSFSNFIQHSVPCLNCDRVKELKNYLKQHPDFMQLEGRYFDKAYFPERKQSFDEQDQQNLIKKLRGLSEIVDVIAEFQIPVVGHNMALDLLYFFRMFCADLPENYEDFKILSSQFLPHVYDTKFMAVNCKKMLNHPVLKANLLDDRKKLESSSLFIVYQKTSLIKDDFVPIIHLNETCSNFQDSLNLGKRSNLEADKNALVHSPGFDACIAGIVFLNIAHISARIDQNFQSRKTPPSKLELFCNVNAWKDQIYLARATIIAMCLKGDDPKPSRPLWIEVRSSKKIEISILKKELSVFGPVDAVQADEKSVRFAAAGGKSGKEMKKFLMTKGLFVENLDIPWDKQRYKYLGKLQFDKVYDRSKMLG